MTDLPGALLLDLDDTILDSYGDPDAVWLRLCQEFAGGLADVTPEELHAAVKSSRDWLWGDPERARRGRLDLPQSRRDIVLGAFARLDIPDSPTAVRMADRYTTVSVAAPYLTVVPSSLSVMPVILIPAVSEVCRSFLFPNGFSF